jgi:hypothetical protein
MLYFAVMAEVLRTGHILLLAVDQIMNRETYPNIFVHYVLKLKSPRIINPTMKSQGTKNRDNRGIGSS